MLYLRRNIKAQLSHQVSGWNTSKELEIPEQKMETKNNFQGQAKLLLAVGSADGEVTSGRHSWIWGENRNKKTSRNLTVHSCISMEPYPPKNSVTNQTHQQLMIAASCCLQATYDIMNPTCSLASSSIGAGRLRSMRPGISRGSCLITKVLLFSSSQTPTKWDFL